MSKKKAAISVIVTILNESKTIIELLDALAHQSLSPHEIIIVDGGSYDGTKEVIQTWQKAHSDIRFHLLHKKGNRSVGRNYAISTARSELIACTDAGCVPEKSWLAELLTCYITNNAPVVAGYYRGQYTTLFEKAVIPYALVLPHKVDEKNFLPATRSLLLEKKVWQDLGGFDESLSDNEDYEFAQRLLYKKIPITFARNAVVIWKPRQNIQQFFWMIFRFARGDIQAKIFRPKVFLIFFRYLFVLLLLVSLLKKFSLSVVVITSIFLFLLYAVWAVQKNYQFVKAGWYWLPVLQYVSDLAVMLGSVAGLKKLLRRSK